jgi:hypothetical protein
MEEGAEGIIRMRHVDVAKHQMHGIILDGLKPPYGHLDVDDGFSGEIRNGGRSVVVDPDREVPQRGRDLGAFRGERIGPGMVIGHDFQSSAHLVTRAAQRPASAAARAIIPPRAVGCKPL